MLFSEIILINFAAPLASRKRKSTGPYRWKPTAPGNGRGFYCQHGTSDSALRCADHGSGFRLRLDHANNHLHHFRLSHINGYTYSDHGETVLPIVARLPRSRGFLAGYTMGAGMCAGLDSYIWCNVEDAARAAHDEAQRVAELNGEDDMADDDMADDDCEDA